MNVSRSTFVPRGYVLTALAVAVLLVATSGTAWAQSLRFSTSSATVDEGASATDSAAPRPLKVNVSRSGEFRVDAGGDGTLDAITPWDGSSNEHVTIKVVEYDGSSNPSTIPLQISARSGGATLTATGLTTTGVSVGFGDDSTRTDNLATTIELTITHAGDNNDWNVETLVLELEAASSLVTHLGTHQLPPIPPNTEPRDSPKKVSYGTRKLTVTVEDDDPMPVFRFSKADIQLAKGNTQTVTVGVGTGARGTGSLPSGDNSIQATLAALTGTGAASGDDVVLAVDPADAVGTIIKISEGTGDSATALVAGSEAGTYVVSKIGGDDGVVTSATGATNTDGITLTIEAIGASGFRDEQISLTLMDGRTEAEKDGEGGPIGDSVPATVTVLSGEETPTVTFSTSSVNIDEGGKETVHLLADGDQGNKVGSATVSVSGDAMISLEQNGSAISGGVVSFGESANAELTIVSLSDRDLEDGEEKTATVTITDASGANIGEQRSVTVTVTGSTAVPVLPLVGQLLLALLLTAGGARLYRRRQQ